MDDLTLAVGQLLAREAGRDKKLDELTLAVKGLLDSQLAEIAGCPFQPRRGTNGNTLISRVDGLERTMGSYRNYLRGILVGVGAMGLIQLGPSGWGILLKFIMG